jgi:hypothetical protein
MIDNLARDLQLLQRADWLITKMWVNVAARHFGLFAFAGLVAVFGLGMMNVAGFYALQVVWGPVWAAAAVGIADFILASVVMLFGRNIEPGPELELALDVRKMAVAAIETDTQELKSTLDSFGEGVRRTKDTFSGLLEHPLDTATEKLLVPAALSMMKGLRSKKA